MPKATFNSETRAGEHVLLVRHTAVVGGATFGKPVRFDDAKPVRRVRVGKPQPYAQYPVSVGVYFVEPGKRNEAGYTVTPDNLRYFTIENESGGVFYDTRQDVPVDMTAFAATRERFVKEWQASGYEVNV